MWLDNNCKLEDIRQKEWIHADAKMIEIIKPIDQYPFYSTKTNKHQKLTFNEFGAGGGENQTRNIIVYESSNSNRFIIRKFKILRKQ